MLKSPWRCVLARDSDRSITAGSETSLCDAIRRGADLRIGTEFIHNEHIDTRSDDDSTVREVAEFRVTYLLEDRWSAGFMTLRQPIELPKGFGDPPSMSFFLYNQDGRQAIGRPVLHGPPTDGAPSASSTDEATDLSKYHVIDQWDGGTNAPSRNFIYDFNYYQYWVRDNWEQLLSHDAEGRVLSGSVEALGKAFQKGCAVKIAVRGLCADLTDATGAAIDHEVFVQSHSGYYYVEKTLLNVGTHPLVRVRPAIPLSYASRNWDFGWAMARTDGYVALRLYDPYTLVPHEQHGRHAIRWFVR